MFTFFRAKRVSLLSDSNQRPLDYKSSALPTELKRRLFQQPFSFGAKSDAKVQQIFQSSKLFPQNPPNTPIFSQIMSTHAYIWHHISLFSSRRSVMQPPHSYRSSHMPMRAFLIKTVTILPFTRVMAGPVDYTPGVFAFENPLLPQTRVNATLMNPYDYVIEEREVRAADKIDLHMASGGGFAIRLKKNE